MTHVWKKKEQAEKALAAGFAPGNYWCKCCSCSEKFDGDKRALNCYVCATKIIDERKKMSLTKPDNVPQEVFVIANAMWESARTSRTLPISAPGAVDPLWEITLQKAAYVYGQIKYHGYDLFNLKELKNLASIKVPKD